MRKNPFRSFVLLVLLLCGTVVSAQDQKSLNYGFVSPNTKEDLKIEQAIKGMESAEETTLIKRSVNLGCVVRSRIRAFRALGSWSDGAEHSVMLRVESDEATVRYLMSRLGRDAQQKSVLYFHPQPAGAAHLYTLKPRKRVRNLAALATTLERAGIAFRTLVPVGSNTWIYVVDPNRDLRARVLAAAQRLRARVRSERGSAEFVGAEQAQQAKVVFDKEIHSYEAKNPNLPPTCDAQKKGGH
jgi:hypothetical protein